MSPFLISLIASVASSGWIYNKLQQRSGGLTSQSVKVAALCSLFLFIILFSLTTMILP